MVTNTKRHLKFKRKKKSHKYFTCILVTTVMDTNTFVNKMFNWFFDTADLTYKNTVRAQ